jgi:hypothetical protein
MTPRLSDRVARVRNAITSPFKRYPWFGWLVWAAFCVNFIVFPLWQPQAFGSTFGVYLEAANRFWDQQPLFDLSDLGGYLYWPILLVVLRPLLWFTPVQAAMIATAFSGALMTVASLTLIRVLFGARYADKATLGAGLLLLTITPACWYNFKYVQAQVGMTAMMMLAAAAIMRSRPVAATLWLLIGAIIKPLAIVMLLLLAAVEPRARLAATGAIVVALIVPFAFADPGYLIAQYHAWFLKLRQVASALPQQWEAQADFAAMLERFSLNPPPQVATIIRALAALGTLLLAWRVGRSQSARVFGIAVLLLSACYINLFNPRNETISFLVLTPGLTALAMLLLTRDEADPRSWLLVLTVLVIGYEWWWFDIDGVLKPAVAFIIAGWLIWLTIQPRRWHELIEGSGVGPLPV